MATDDQEAFDFVFLACIENKWTRSLVDALEREDRFLDVVKVLLYEKRMDDLCAMFQGRGKFCECVFVLEKMGKFREAAELLERIGPDSYYEIFDAEDGEGEGARVAGPGCVFVDMNAWRNHQREIYAAKLSQLRGSANVCGHHEDGDAPLSVRHERRCSSCSNPVECESARFCSYCGASL